MRVLTKLFILLTIGHLLTQYTLAQTEDALIKTSLPSQHIFSIVTTSNGLIAGEYDGRIWDQPYNGLFVSNDKGESWAPLALQGRGITDLCFQEGVLYAATYYTHSDVHADGVAGLFISDDLGETYRHADLDFATSNVEVPGDAIFVGG